MFSKARRFSFKKKLPKNIINSPSFSLRYERNDEGLKVAVVVSKKVDKRAVVRNSAKRKILEFLGQLVGADEKLNLVFYTRPGIQETQNLKEEIENVINKINNV